MLWRALQHVQNGFYIDVGAADPVEMSVTRVFYDHGWHGINLEPNDDYFNLLQAARPRDINLKLGAGQASGQQVFHSIPGTGLSTFDAAVAARHRQDGWTVTEHTVETRTLAELCRLHRPTGPIHFLKIDVEGAEAEVLAGADFRAFRPWIVLVEETEPLSQEQSHAAWEAHLTTHGYQFVWFDGLNRFYLADEKMAELARHFRVQPNIFDGFVPAPVFQRQAEVQKASSPALEHGAEQAQEVESQRISLLEARAVMAEQRLHEAQVQLNAFRQAEAGLSQIPAQERQALPASRRPVQAPGADADAGAGSPPFITRSARVLGRLVRGEMQAKTLAREVVRRSVRGVLSAPAGRQLARKARLAAPDLAQWFLLRYRAYEQHAASSANNFPAGYLQSPVVQACALAGKLDLSDEEARLYRSYASYRLSAQPAR